MPAATLDACSKFFGTRDVYDLFELNKDSAEKESKFGVNEISYTSS